MQLGLSESDSQLSTLLTLGGREGSSGSDLFQGLLEVIGGCLLPELEKSTGRIGCFTLTSASCVLMRFPPRWEAFILEETAIEQGLK